MRKKDISKYCIGISIVGLSLAGKADHKPNIILIYVDDMGYGDLSLYGGDIPTPNIDRIGREGIQFTNFYAASPVCTPSRYSLLTGSYPQRSCHGLEKVGMPGGDDHLDDAETILPRYLKQMGYSTAITGKWHLGSAKKDYFPQKHGFDLFIGHVDGCIDYFRHTYAGWGNSWYRNGDPLIEDGYATDLITGHAVDYISDQSKKGVPYFLFLSYNAPHYGKTDPGDVPDSTLSLKLTRFKGMDMINSLQVEPEYLNRFKHVQDSAKRYYAAMITNLDDNIGRILKKLEEIGNPENTMIWFISDNGGYAESYSGYASNGRLRGEKGTLYEGGIRVPALLCWKDQIKPNQTMDDLLCTIDIVPTLARIIGFEAMTDKKKLDGIDISGTILHREKTDRAVYWSFKPSRQVAYRRGEWKMVNDELYNLRTDERESDDLSKRYPEKLNELKKAFSAMDEQIHCR
ncbi:MAG: sulfatase-like hydrolase/transferase [Prolixibacteraceae bacterium]